MTILRARRRQVAPACPNLGGRTLAGPYIDPVPRTAALTSALARLAAALVLSLLAGVLLAGLAFPVIGGAGLAAKAGADTFLALPADLKTPRLPQRSVILDKNGGIIASLFLENRVPVQLKVGTSTAEQ